MSRLWQEFFDQHPLEYLQNGFTHNTLAADTHPNAGSSILSAEQIIAWHNRILDGMYGPQHGFEESVGIEVKPSNEIVF